MLKLSTFSDQQKTLAYKMKSSEMPYKINMGDDGILRIANIGDMGDEDIEPYFGAFMSFLETATEAEPLQVLSDNSREGKISGAFRRKLAELADDPRIGKSAFVGANRYTRVLASFVIKATGRENTRFFDSEEEALAWLKAES